MTSRTVKGTYAYYSENLKIEITIWCLWEVNVLKWLIEYEVWQ